MLKLHKPLIFLDIETTGLNITKDRIIEICLVKQSPDGSVEDKTWRINPGMPILQKITELTGISDADVANAPQFAELANTLLNFIGNADLSGYNAAKFDIPLLMEEFDRAKVDFDINGRKIIDVQQIYHMMERRNLAAAYQFYCNKELTNAHSALADVEATREVFLAQLEKYTELGETLDSITAVAGNPLGKNVDVAGRIIMDDSGTEVFNFGKYKGDKVEDVLKKDLGYYNWMMQGDFASYTKKKLTEIKLRMRAN